MAEEDLQGSVGSEDKHTYTKCSGGLRGARLRLATKVEMSEWSAQTVRLRVDWQRQTRRYEQGRSCPDVSDSRGTQVLVDVFDKGGLGNSGNGPQFAATSHRQVDRSMANTRFNRAIQLIGAARSGTHRSTVRWLP